MAIAVETLKTERLVLKKITGQNLGDYTEWKSQQEYHDFLPSSPKTDYKDTLNKIVKGYDNLEDPTLLWGIFLGDKLIGSVSIENWNTTHKWCELGWGLNPKYQHNGYAFEAVSCLINHIFNTLNMNRVSIVIWDGNNQSKHLAEKLGFVKEGVDRKARFKNGKYIDLYRYGLLKEEWEGRKVCKK